MIDRAERLAEVYQTRLECLDCVPTPADVQATISTDASLFCAYAGDLLRGDLELVVNQLAQIRQRYLDFGRTLTRPALSAAFVDENIAWPARERAVLELRRENALGFVFWHDLSHAITSAVGMIHLGESVLYGTTGEIVNDATREPSWSNYHDVTWSAEAFELLKKDGSGRTLLDLYCAQVREAARSYEGRKDLSPHLVTEYIVAGTVLARDAYRAIYPRTAVFTNPIPEELTLPQPYDFADNFQAALVIVGLDHEYAFAEVDEHYLIKPRRFMGRRLSPSWFSQRVAQIHCESSLDAGPILTNFAHSGLVIEVMDREVRPNVDWFVVNLQTKYPEEDITVYNLGD